MSCRSYAVLIIYWAFTVLLVSTPDDVEKYNFSSSINSVGMQSATSMISHQNW